MVSRPRTPVIISICRPRREERILPIPRPRREGLGEGFNRMSQQLMRNKSIMKATLPAMIAVSLGLAGLGVYAAKGDEKMDTRVFELRTYTAAPGKMEALH